MMDPRISGSGQDYNQNSFDGMSGEMTGSDPWDDGMGMEERMQMRRAERMYQEMAARGQFAQIDKAKHNLNYRNYLLQNFAPDEDGYGF